MSSGRWNYHIPSYQTCRNYLERSLPDPIVPCRILWAFARDGGLPFSSTLQRVTPGTRVPVYAVIFTTFCCVLLALPILGSQVALSACISLALLCESQSNWSHLWLTSTQPRIPFALISLIYCIYASSTNAADCSAHESMNVDSL